MCKFLNVEGTCSGDIIYNSRTRSSVGKYQRTEALFLMCLLGWSSTNKILASLQLNNILWCPKRTSLSLRKKDMFILMNPFIFVHFYLPLTNASLQMTSSRNRRRSTLWRTASFMHDHITTWKFCKCSDVKSRSPC